MARPQSQSRLMVLMFTDIVGSVDLKQRLGDAKAADLVRRHDDLFRATVGAFSLAEILQDLGDGFMARFVSAADAVHAALHFQRSLQSAEPPARLGVRVGIHLGEASEIGAGTQDGPVKISGLAVDIASRVMSLALPAQILMTRAAFDNARQYVRDDAAPDGTHEEAARKWMAHGRYLFQGADEALEVFEVGEVGVAPLRVPPDTNKARRAVAADQEETLGWRPAVGMAVPDRRHWALERKLGEGGFGEVWLAENERTHERRVLKFCFDAERLRSFKREIMLFRLLRESLGDRHDIAKLYEVQVDHPPFYLESEFTEDGSLVEWAERQGGIDAVPLATRLDLVARTALAVAAAHSVGVLHKDIKPSNILIYRGGSGEPQPRLTDFGIGALTDPTLALQRNITMIGTTEAAIIDGADESRTGTRLYTPPEALVGKPFTIQGDVYALGVLLYQMVVGDLDRPLAQGWERDVPDPLLREDIACCVEGHEDERLGSARELAERLQKLPLRRRTRRRRRAARYAGLASVLMLVLLSLAGVWLLRETRLRLLKEREAEKAVAISHFLQRMISSIDPRLPQEQKGRNVKVADTLDQAVRELEAGALHEPEVEAAVRGSIGNAYRALGLFPSAERQLQLALDLRRSVLGDHHLEVAQNLEDLASVRYQVNDFSPAREMNEQALQIRESLLDGDHIEIASSLNHLAACLDRLEQHDQAESLYRRALEMRQRLADRLMQQPSARPAEVLERRELVARSLNNLGMCLRAAGKLDQAEPLLLQALALVRELRGDEYIDVANGLSNLGTLYLRKGALASADTHLQEALSLKRKVLGNGHASLAVTLQALAEVRYRQKRYPEAETLVREAIVIRTAALTDANPQTIESQNWLETILEAQRDEGSQASLANSSEPERAIASSQPAPLQP